MSKILRLYKQIVSNGGARVKGLGRLGAIVRLAVTLAMGTMGASFFVATPARASPFDPSGNDWEGYADFVRLIRGDVSSQRLTITHRIEWGSLTPNDALILVYPDHSLDSGSAGAFVRAGGRLALLDDFGAGDTLLTSFDIKRVPLPPRPVLALRDNPDLPIAEPGPNEQPLTRGVDRVVTNHASGLLQPQLNVVLRVRGTDNTEVPLALSATSGQGRLLAIGDPSIFMTSMLRYPGNRELAKNLIQYLVQGHPTGQIVLVVTTFEETGAFAGMASPAHEGFAVLQRAMESIGRDGFPGWLMYAWSFMMAILVVVWLVPHAVRMYRGERPRFTRPIPLELQGGVAGHAAAMRAKQAYRGHAMLEWKRAFTDDLTGHFGLPPDASSAEVVKRVARLGVVDAEAMRGVERLLLRMAEIDTMISAKQTHALMPIGDQEVVAAGELVTRVLARVHRREGQASS